MVLLFSRSKVSELSSNIRGLHPADAAAANSSVAASVGGPVDPLACRLMSFIEGPQRIACITRCGSNLWK